MRGFRDWFWPALVIALSCITSFAILTAPTLEIRLIIADFFFIPVILAGYRYQQKGILVAAGLAGLNLLIHASTTDPPGIWLSPVLLQSIAFITVAALVSIIFLPLRMWEDWKRSMIEHASWAICVVDPRTRRVVRANRQLSSLAGYGQDELEGMPFASLVRSPVDFNTFFTRIEEAGSIAEVEAEVIRGSGSTMWASLAAERTEEGHVLVQVFDITRYKAAEEEIRKNARDLEIKNSQLEVLRSQLSVVNKDLDEMVRERTAEVENLLRQKDDFITQLGHDLKTPLTPLVALLPRIRKDEQDPRLKDLLEICAENANSMKNLVLKTLKLARLNSTYIELDTEELALKGEIGAVLQNNEYILRDRNITVENRVPGHFTVSADRILLREVLENVLGNAIKYMTAGGGEVTFDATRERRRVTVSVHDSGTGMTREEIARIFDEFYKADTSRHDTHSSGLGLAICRRIIEKHGGTIRAESPGRGRGSTIFFTLPSA